MPFSQLIRNEFKLNSICSKFYATNCWSCKRVFNEKETKKLVCPCSREIIQAPDKNLNYFELFNLNASFSINQKDLTKSFRDLMRVLHPDKFTNKSNLEKEYSADQSSFVNNAYKILSNDLDRAFYLLKVKNYPTEPEGVMDQRFLFDIMEMNERASDLKDANQVKLFDIEILNLIKLHTKELSISFELNRLDEALISANKLRFYKNLYETIRETKFKFGIQD